MRLVNWVIVLIVSLTLATIGFIEGYSLVDFLATSALIFISIYFVLRYFLSIMFRVNLEPLLYIDIRYLYLSVLYGVSISILGYTLDSILSLLIPKTIFLYIAMALIPAIIIHFINKVFGFKGLRIALTISIFILSILYMLGYVEEFTTV